MIVRKSRFVGEYRICLECKISKNIFCRKNGVICLDCIKTRDRLRHYKNYDSQKEKIKSKKRKRNIGYTKASLKWQKQNSFKLKAHNIIKVAIASGKLIRGCCIVCGNNKTDGHHPDYSKPLEVIWLCRQHHKDIHSKRLLE